MAEAQGVGKDMISDIWRAHNIQPHRTKRFKLSRDPRFLEKLTDVVGLYLNPPEQALVLCVDEKSQIQALDRTQPGLPLKKGRLSTMTHDYKRNGTTCLFAALEVLQGKVIGQCYGRHRHQEFLKFLRRLDAEFPGSVPLHLVMDNYGTHQHPNVQAWLKRHRRFKFHFTPTSGSWLNLVERWFAELTNKAVRRGSFASVEDLELAIEQFLEAWNDNPRPFVWTASIESITEKLAAAVRRSNASSRVAPRHVAEKQKASYFNGHSTSSLAFAFAVAIASSATASAADTITTDRPDAVESSLTVGRGRFQIETSVAQERDKDAGTKTTVRTTPTLLRLGVTENVEIRLESEGLRSR